MFPDSQSSPAVKEDMEDANIWDFGQVKEGEVLSHEFIFKNASKNTLNIRRVDTSCGCTASKIKKDSLAPGEKTIIEVKFNTRGYFGQTKQHVYVHTDNIDNEIFEYTIKAEVTKN